MKENVCPECEKEFDSEEGLEQHKQAKHTEVKKSINKKKIINWSIFIVIVVLIIGGVYLLVVNMSNSTAIGAVGSTHEHADFKVYINGEKIDFSQSKYMVRAKQVHVEDMNGNLIHKHATGVTLGYFFDSLGFKFDGECFVLDNGESYCNNDEKTLKLYVNGKENLEYGDYEIRSLDKFLITYGDDSEEGIQTQLDSITNYAIKE